MVIQADNFNDLFKNAFIGLKNHGKLTHPRGFNCIELPSVQLILTDPTDCLITISERKLNYAYLTIEKLSYLTGRHDVKIFTAYNKKMADFVNEKTDTFDGAYGPRILTQLNWVRDELIQDPDSRRAVITIRDSSDCKPTKDHPCTLALQFLLRDGKLDLITTMRSNDLLWGTCLDVPAFCFIQEVMAHWLGVEIGTYYHHAGSLHYYVEYEEKLDETYNGSVKDNPPVLPKWDLSYEETAICLERFWVLETAVRNGASQPLVATTGSKCLDEYLEQLRLYWLNKKHV